MNKQYKVVISQSGKNDVKSIVTVLRILQDGMDWEYIIQQWIQINS